MTAPPRLRRPGAAERAPRRPVGFTFDGKAYEGLEGDTLAAALLANGVRIVGRSLKLHRPRGIMGSGVEEANALVQLEAGGHTEPNARATLIEIHPGLQARSQNAWPSVEHDLLGVLDWFHRLLPAAFYYKSMMWPNWPLYEHVVRRLAGLGQSPTLPDPQHYHHRNAHCDVLVVGAGPAGLAAAQVCAAQGLRTVLVDEQSEPGGALLSETAPIEGLDAAQWARQACDALAALPNVKVLLRTTATSCHEHNVVAAVERVTQHLGPAADARQPRERLWRIRARHLILATGAIERPLVFPDNDRPGVMLASAVRCYANRFGVVPGERIVLATNNDSAYATAFDLATLGRSEITVVDTRARPPEPLVAAAAASGVQVLAGSGIAGVQGTRGIRAVRLARHAGGGRLDKDETTLACDLLGTSSGWTPTVHLFSQAGGALDFDAAQLCLVPRAQGRALSVAGSANGSFSMADCIEEGRSAAAAAVQALLGTPATPGPAARTRLGIEAFWTVSSRPSDRQWLDLLHDVKVSDVELALRENYVSVEHVKRYTTGGMGADQGKTGNFNILAVMAELTGRHLPDVGTTRFRPPYAPVTLGTLAGAGIGELHSPWQDLPAHAFHLAHNARFGDYGWRRPEFYPLPGEDVAAATRREVNAVRTGVGLFDGSPLGKIEVRGPDAAEFLNRMFVNHLATLRPGAARYAILANENGVVIDDGVIVHMAADHFLVHATSGAVQRVTRLFEEYLQCEWPGLEVCVSNVTTQWANATVSGPKARSVVQCLASNIDFGASAFGHMQFRRGTVAGVPARVLRASFTGETTFEISVPARYAQSLFESIHAAGQGFGLVPYGIEALQVMRIEKGYLHVGGDTDGSTNVRDIGWGAVADNKPGDFVGKRSLQRVADAAPDRLQFVGLEPLDPAARVPVGGHFISERRSAPPLASEGYVTAACFSPTLGRTIGLGRLKGGRARTGQEVWVYCAGAFTPVRVVAPAHLDPKGARLHV